MSGSPALQRRSWVHSRRSATMVRGRWMSAAARPRGRSARRSRSAWRSLAHCSDDRAAGEDEEARRARTTLSSWLSRRRSRRRSSPSTSSRARKTRSSFASTRCCWRMPPGRWPASSSSGWASSGSRFQRSRTSTTTSCSSTTRTLRTTPICAALPRATASSTPGRATASPTTSTSSASPARDGSSSAPTVTPRWRARSACLPSALGRPIVVGVELRGRLRPWVQSKDVVLELLRRRGVRGGRGRILEFHGEGTAGLTATDRGTICNMVMETGATTGVFPSDEQTLRWLTAQGRADEFVELAPDPGASYDEAELIDLGRLEPLVALPSSPGNVVAVREAAGTPTRQVCVGSSVNSSYEDLAVVAAVLRERSLPDHLDLTVSPGSRQILDMIVRSGVYADLLAAGARILEPACGPCIGMGQAPAAGAVSVRTFNRNFPGRSGTADDRVFLYSPATAAATALRGEIADPRELGEPPELAPPPTNPDVDDRQIVSPPEPAQARLVELQKGRNIVAPPPVAPLPESIEARVLIVVPDDVSTGDMAPDGALGLAIWSNIPACARYMFRRLDPDFPARAQEWGGGIVVGGHNYGQGSSREQAAFVALYLGVRAVIAKSFARIHRSNLIAQGILPLSFADEADYQRAELGQEWSIPVDVGQSERHAETPLGPVRLQLRLTAREREILRSGGLIAHAASSASGSRSG